MTRPAADLAGGDRRGVARRPPWRPGSAGRSTALATPEATAVGIVLGARVADLPPVVRRVHASREDLACAGVLRVEQSATRLGRWMARRMGLPAMGGDTETTVVIHRSHRVERAGGRDGSRVAPSSDRLGEAWRRSFGGHVLASTVTTDGERLVERVGRFELSFDLAVADERLAFRHVGTHARFGRWRVRVPGWLAPRIEASAGASADGAQLDVVIRVAGPVLGSLLSYAGRLTPEEIA